MSSCSTALRWLVPCFKSWSLSRITTFFSFRVKLVRFVGAILHEGDTITHVCKQMWLWLPRKVSLKQPHLQFRPICAALSASMFPLAPLKVSDVSGGLDDISEGFYDVKIRFRSKMANISGWMMYLPWMIAPNSTVTSSLFHRFW